MFQKPSLLPRPLSNALERPKTLPPPVPAPKPAPPPENLNPDVEHIESPEKLSLKARLKLFEKEIEQQGSAPAPKPGIYWLGSWIYLGKLLELPKKRS